MELTAVSTIEVARRPRLKRASGTSPHIRCSAFHPSDPTIFIALDDEIYMCGAMQGSIMGRYSINAGFIVNLFPAKTEPLLGALVSLEEEFVVYVWNTHQHILKNVYHIKHVSPKKPNIWAFGSETKLYFAQQGSKTLHVLEWKDGSIKKIESPKTLTNIQMHPFKPFLATILSDGTIRVINVVTNTATVWSEPHTTGNASESKEKSVCPVLVSFHPTQPYMVAAMSNGCVSCWDTSSANDPYLGTIKVVSKDRDSIDYLHFHPTLPFLVTGSNEGIFMTWNFFPLKKSWLVKIVDTFGSWETNPSQIEALIRNAQLPSHLKQSNDPLVLTDLRVHPTYNFYSFNFRVIGKSSETFHHGLETIKHRIYGFTLHDAQLCNMIVPQQQSIIFWASPEKETRVVNVSKSLKNSASNIGSPPTTRQSDSVSGKSNSQKDSLETSSKQLMFTPRDGSNESPGKTTINVFSFPNECYFLDDLNLLAYSPAYNDTSLAKKLPVADFEGYVLRPTRLVRSYNTDRFLVFFLRQSADQNKVETSFALAVVSRDTATKDITVSPAAGQTGIFFGNEEEFLVLSESGTKIEIWKNEEDTTLPMVYDLPFPMADIFWTPLERCGIIFLMDVNNCRLLSSQKTMTVGSKFMVNTDKNFLQLWPEEYVIQILWQRTDSGQIVDATSMIAAILTTKRVLIVDSELKVLSSCQEQATSCIWLGATVLFTTKSHLKYLTLKNQCLPLISLQLPDAVLVSVLCDRVALAVRKSGETMIVTNAVGLLEPLVIGFLHYFESELDDMDRKSRTLLLQNCAESYDAKRISWGLIEAVTKQGYKEFALQLLLSNPQLLSPRTQFAFDLAIDTHHFSTAFDLIERNTHLKQQSNLYILQQASLKLGQFDIARKCAESNSDWVTLLYIYTLFKNQEGMILLKKRLVENNPELYRGLIKLVDKQLASLESAPGSSKPSNSAAKDSSNTLATPGTASTAPILKSKISAPHLTLTTEKRTVPTRQDSGNPSNKHQADKNRLVYTNHPILENMPYVSKAAQKGWKVEAQTQLPSEMRTLPLDSGSGNLVIGPLLLDKLLGDWFNRQVPYFELPEALRGDPAKREAVLKLLSQSNNSSAFPRSSSTASTGSNLRPNAPAYVAPSASDVESRHTRRTMTLGDTGVTSPVASMEGSVPSLPLSMLESKKAGMLASARPTASSVNTLTISTGPIPSTGERSPRKHGASAARAPNSAVAAGLMTAIANSGQTLRPGGALTTLTAPIPESHSKLGVNMGTSPGTTPPSIVPSSENEESSGGSPLDAYNPLSNRNSGIQDVTTTQILALAEQALTSDSMTLVTSALSKLEKADYDGCILDLNAVLLSVLARFGQQADVPQSPLAINQIQFTVRYKMACIIIYEIQKLEATGTNSALVAQLSQFLAGLPVLPRHRLVLLRMALKKNLIAQNYGFASKCLDMLLAKPISDKDKLVALQTECKDKNLKDAEPLEVGSKLCLKSMKFITAKQSSIDCKLCNASYHENLISLSSPCMYCFWRGGLVKVKSSVLPVERAKTGLMINNQLSP